MPSVRHGEASALFLGFNLGVYFTVAIFVFTGGCQL